ncbi:MAG TPA: hypothetical protein VIN59_00505 [Alphaproteobacteria bacterium]
MADVVIVGGGPIGNWTAIQLKARNPKLDVQIYERHPDYMRDHLLNIREMSFDRHAAPKTPETENLRERIIRAHRGMNVADKTIVLQTQDLESILKTEAERLGVKTTYETIQSPQDVMMRHPECKLFVAADGTRSAMRNALLGQNSVEETPMFESMDVTYDSRGKPGFVSRPTFDRVDDMVVESISRGKDGISTVNLRFLVDEAMYASLFEATFKTPLTFDRIAEIRKSYGQRNIDMFRVENHIREFMKIRAQEAGDDFIPGTERIVRVKLSRYASEKFAVKTAAPALETGWFMVGDAAMGMPFSRSINSGLMQGSQLANILADPNTSFAQKIAQYEGTRAGKLREEFTGVAAKEGLVKFYQNGVRPILRAGGKVAFVVIGIPVMVVLFGLSALTGGRLGLRLM